MAELSTLGSVIKTAYEAQPNAFTDAKDTKLAGIETAATADQTAAEIAAAYQTQVPLISQAAAEAGTATGIESWSALRVAQAIAALAGGGGAFTADVNTQITPSTAILLDQATGNEVALDLSFTVNKAAGNYGGIKCYATETAAPGTDDRLFDVGVGATSKFYISDSGNVTGVGNMNIGAGNFINTNCRIGGTQGNLFLNSIEITDNLNTRKNFIVYDGLGIINIYDPINFTTAQTLRISASHTSTSNYQRCGIVTKRTATTVPAAATFTLTGFIPDGALLLGITSRVDTTCTTATGYTVGDGVDADLWGVAAAVAVGTATGSVDFTAAGASGVLYTAAQNVVITATGGNFDGTGVITVCGHYIITEAD